MKNNLKEITSKILKILKKEEKKMNDKEINMSKVIITAVSALILVIIIAVLTIVLTNKKQAAEVVAETSQTQQPQVSKEENVWKSTNVTPTENTIINNSTTDNSNVTVNNNTTESSNVVENKPSLDGENTITNNIITENNSISENNNANQANSIQNQGENSIIQNNSVENQTSNNTTPNNTSPNNTNPNNTGNTEPKKSNNGVIWLTFDDGPSAKLTPKVLDILKKENVKATFFVINYSESNEPIIKRIVAEGHTIGIHGYSHEYSKIYKSKETFMSNIYTLQDKIYKSTGVKSMYIRFPGGSSNTVSRKYCKGIMTELTKEVLAKGFKYFDWNISSGDAGGAKDAKAVYKNVKKSLSKKRGNLVLCHDIHQKTLEALPDIIKYAKKEGYTFARIDDDTPMYAQHVNN